MTHRIQDRRWQENPHRRVGKAQLSRVEKAASIPEQPASPSRREPTSEIQLTFRTKEQQ